MNKYLIIIIVIMAIIKSCTKVEVENVHDFNQIEKYKQKVISIGDEYAYNRLMEYYDTNNQPDLLPYSFIMADTYNFTRANYFIYRDIVKLNNGMPQLFNDSLFSNVPLFQKNVALYYLERGAISDDVSSIKALLKYYYINEPEKTDSLENKLKKILPSTDAPSHE